MATALPRHRFGTQQLLAMVRAGILEEDDRLELLDGEIYEMASISPRHAVCVDKLTRWFVRQTSDDVIARGQNPAQVGERSLPRPDLAIVWTADYLGRHPGASEILLVVEVAETSLAADQWKVQQIYLPAAVPHVWLVDLGAEKVRVWTQSTPHDYGRGETIEIPALSLAVPVAAVLPWRSSAHRLARLSA